MRFTYRVTVDVVVDAAERPIPLAVRRTVAGVLADGLAHGPVAPALRAFDVVEAVLQAEGDRLPGR